MQKFLSRKTHDFYTNAVVVTGPPLRKCKEDVALAQLSHTKVQDAGQVNLDNKLEGDFYSQSEKISPHHWPHGHLYHLRNARVTGDQGCIFLEDGRCLYICPSLNRLPDRKIRRPINLFAQRVREPAFHLTGFSHENHGHFILNHLPRLVSALEFLLKNPEIKILCAKGHSKWQLRYLSRLGFGPERVLECSHGTMIFDELYYVPTLNGRNNLAEPIHYQKLQSYFVNEVKSQVEILRQSPTMGKPIFITRANAPDKRIRNESEIINIISEVFGGVECIELTGIPMNEQILIFNRASIIIGPMGQGLTNILYSKGKVLVVLDRSGCQVGTGASAMFRDLAAVCGNQAIRIASGTDYEEGKRFYHFPPDEFRKSLLLLRDLLSTQG